MEMKVQVLSDVHFTNRYRYGVNEGVALTRMLMMVEQRKCDELILTGDLGYAWTQADWEMLVKRIRTNAGFGNHDDINLISRITNADGTNVLVSDGEVREIGGLKFGFINGIIGSRAKEGIQRKTSQEFVSIARDLRGVDVLCMHDSPLNDERLNSHTHIKSAVYDAILKARPTFSFSGHVHGGFSLSMIGRTVHANIDSSMKNRVFAVLDTDAMKVELWHDLDRKPFMKFAHGQNEKQSFAHSLLHGIHRSGAHHESEKKTPVKLISK